MKRFWDKVNKTNGCWLWVGAIGKRGYGTFKLNGKVESAHRVAWAIENGPVPDALFVLHNCDTKICVNPAHLFLGTQADNVRDAAEKCKMGNTRLSKEQVLVIRDSTAPQATLATLFGVGQPTISQIKSKIYRPHIK